jgi:hypothetical protein
MYRRANHEKIPYGMEELKKETRDYIDGVKIIDIHKASKKN